MQNLGYYVVILNPNPFQWSAHCSEVYCCL